MHKHTTAETYGNLHKLTFRNAADIRRDKSIECTVLIAEYR